MKKKLIGAAATVVAALSIGACGTHTVYRDTGYVPTTVVQHHYTDTYHTTHHTTTPRVSTVKPVKPAKVKPAKVKEKTVTKTKKSLFGGTKTTTTRSYKSSRR